MGKAGRLLQCIVGQGHSVQWTKWLRLAGRRSVGRAEGRGWWAALSLWENETTILSNCSQQGGAPVNHGVKFCWKKTSIFTSVGPARPPPTLSWCRRILRTRRSCSGERDPVQPPPLAGGAQVCTARCCGSPPPSHSPASPRTCCGVHACQTGVSLPSHLSWFTCVFSSVVWFCTE